MFEKEAEEYAHEHCCDSCKNLQARYRKVYQDGAEFGYNKAFVEADKNLKAIVMDFNKANEWHYVKDGDYPKKKGIYLVAWKRTHHVEEYGEWGFDVDVFNADDGYFEGCGDFVIAWKEIVLQKENE